MFGVAFLLRLLVPLTSGGLTGTYGYDASVYYAAGAALVHGRVPYDDFVLLHPPAVLFATAPAAWIGGWTDDQTGFAVATVLFAAIGATNAVAVAAVGRGLGLGRRASIVGGLFYAVWFGAIHAEYQSRLEPLANFFMLCGLLGYTRIDRQGDSTRSAILCGVGLGVSTCVKLWYAVPLTVVVVWLLVARRRRGTATWVALGAAAAITAICGPFFVLARSAMWEMVIAQQLGRDQSNSLRETLMLQRLPSELPSWSVVHLLDAVLLTAAVLLAVLAWRAPAARLAVALVFAQAAALLAAPSWFVFYLDYLTPAVALCIAASVTLRRATGRPTDRATSRGAAARAATVTAVLVVGLVLVVPAVGLWYGRGSVVRSFPTATLAPEVAGSRCVMSDSPMGLIALNALSRSLSNGCRNWVDVTGRTYAPDMVVRDADGDRVPRRANHRWQRALRAYLLSGDALIVRHARSTEMAPTTWAAIRRGGVLASEDGHVVYRVRRDAPQRGGPSG